jgi:hypothetical protein
MVGDQHMSRRVMSVALPLTMVSVLACAAGIRSAAAATGVATPSIAPSIVKTTVGSVSAPLQVAVPSVTTSPAQHTATVVFTPAPAGSASANVVKIDPLDTCVSCTTAQAGPASASSTAKAVRLLGQDISAGDSNNASGSGALIAFPANPLLSLMIADWMANAKSSANASESHSRAALVDLSLANGQIATVAVLEAVSNSTWNAQKSHGDGANNGVDLSLGSGALVIILLHSEASSDGHGNAYIASINGNEILSSGQTGGIPIVIPGMITITLLDVHASGGTASALVGTVSDLGGTPGEVAGVLTASSAGGLVPPPAATPAAPAAPVTGAPAPSGLAVPSTGTALPLVAVALFISGLCLLGMVARRRRGEAAIA